MPFLDDLRNATTPVEISHGAHKFTLECALEKESHTLADAPSENTTFALLEEDEYQLELKLQVLRNRAQNAIADIGGLGDVDALRAELMQERDARLSARQRKTAPEVSLAEIEAEATRRVDAFQKTLEQTRLEIEQTRAAIMLARAKQVAFLVASSDIETREGHAVLSNAVNKTPEQLSADAKVFASFSDILLDRCLKAVSEAVHGPLGQAG